VQYYKIRLNKKETNFHGPIPILGFPIIQLSAYDATLGSEFYYRNMSGLNKVMTLAACVVIKPTLLDPTSEFDKSHCWY
jgi:hypothetical protein